VDRGQQNRSYDRRRSIGENGLTFPEREGGGETRKEHL